MALKVVHEYKQMGVVHEYKQMRSVVHEYKQKGSFSMNISEELDSPRLLG
jgi:hypothetical protein